MHLNASRNQTMNENRLYRTEWIGLLWIGAIFILAFRPIEDFDTFWQLQSGRYMWQTGEFIYRDIFSIASDAYRLEHCWLSDLIFYALYSAGGYAALTLLKPVVISLCAGLLYNWSTVRSVNTVITVPVLALCLMASKPSWLVRPQLWTFLFSLLYLHLLYRGRERGMKAWLWLPLIMLFWANLHAGCVFGLTLIALFGAGELIRFFKKEVPWEHIKNLAYTGVLVLAATFVNPYGYRIPMVLFGNINLYGLENPAQLGVMEWLPPTFSQVPLFYFVMALWGVLIIIRMRRIDPSEAILFAAFLYMGLGQVRHTTLVSLLAAFFLPASFQDALSISLKRYCFSLSFAKFCKGVSVLLLIGLLLQSGVRGALGWGLKEGEFPVAAADFLLENRLPPNIYNSYDWGGYLMWRVFPEYRVFVDGRAGSLETFNASDRIDNSLKGWKETLGHYGINTVITRTCYEDTGEPIPLVEALARDKEWAPVYSDGVAVIFIKREERFRHLWERLEVQHVQVYKTLFAEAKRLYDEDSSRSRALLALGRASLQLGRYSEAYRYYTLYMEAFPEDKNVPFVLDILRRQGIR